MADKGKFTDVSTDQQPGYREKESFDAGEVHDNHDDLQRHLGNRQIQLIAIGGSIGTALFVR